MKFKLELWLKGYNKARQEALNDLTDGEIA